MCMIRDVSEWEKEMQTMRERGAAGLVLLHVFWIYDTFGMLF